MTDLVKRAPHVATIEEIRDYLEWMIQAGKGKYRLEMRAHLLAIPPEGDTHDDGDQVVFLRGIF